MQAQAKKRTFRRRLLSKREAQPFPAKPSFPALRQDIAPVAIGFLPARRQGSESQADSVTRCVLDRNSVQSRRADRSQNRPLSVLRLQS